MDSLDFPFATLWNPRRSVEPLALLPQASKKWIKEKQPTLEPPAGVDESDRNARRRERDKFAEDIAGYREEVKDLRVGIAILKESRDAWKEAPGSGKAIPFWAWCLMNRAFLDTGRVEDKTSWRLFQLGFIIANIVSPSTRLKEFEHHYNENEVAIESASLLYFATGGGKSEAFFG